MKYGKLTKSITGAGTIAVLVVLGGPALAQDAGTPDSAHVVDQPKPFSRNPIPPTWISTSLGTCSGAIPTFTPRNPWTAA
jgi:hypothetical protein